MQHDDNAQNKAPSASSIPPVPEDGNGNQDGDKTVQDGNKMAHDGDGIQMNQDGSDDGTMYSPATPIAEAEQDESPARSCREQQKTNSR